MMITEEEKRDIIEQAKEEFLLMLPATIGNLLANHAAMTKLNAQFYKDHPEFAENKQVVASVLEKVDGENPLLPYEDKLNKAIPLIRERMQMIGGL
jgi:hypothetical protein